MTATPNPHRGRRGWTWQHILRPQVLANARGICALCASTTCPTCGRQACGGRTPPGQVDHIHSPLTHPHLAETIENLRAAHRHCNQQRGSPAARVHSQPW